MKVSDFKSMYPMYANVPDNILMEKVNAKKPGMITEIGSSGGFQPSGNYQQDILKYGATPAIRGQVDAYYNPPAAATGQKSFAIDQQKAPLGSFITKEDPNNPLTAYTKRVGYSPDQIQQFKREDLAKGIPRADVEAYYKTFDPTDQESIAMAQYEKNKFKTGNAYKSTTGLIDELEKNYTEAKGGEGTGIEARAKGFLKDIAGTAGYNASAKIYNDQRNAMIATIKQITGDTGVMTEEDAERLKGLMPPLGATGDEAEKAWTAVRQFIANKYGTEATKTTYKRPDGQEAPLPSIQSTMRVKKEVGGDETYNKLQEANRLAKQSLTETDPKKKEALLAKSRALSDIGMDENSKKTVNPITLGAAKAQKFLGESEALPIIGSVVGRTVVRLPGIGAGWGAGMGEEMRQTLKTGGLEGFLPSSEKTKAVENKMLEYGALDLALYGGGKALKVMANPFKAVGDWRAAKIAEASGKTIGTDKLLGALEQGAEKVSPTVRQGYMRFLKEAKDMYKAKPTLTVDEAVELNSAANDAFTASGKIGKAASAKFNKILGDTIREQLKITAPDVYKANQLFKIAYGSKDLIKKYGPQAIIAALIANAIKTQ